ncbi:hypothetical protein NL676_018223 [Syzygium grande]|nr:hypothetical protein NL676_018223 [Syzygium grande]
MRVALPGLPNSPTRLVATSSRPWTKRPAHLSPTPPTGVTRPHAGDRFLVAPTRDVAMTDDRSRSSNPDDWAGWASQGR